MVQSTYFLKYPKLCLISVGLMELEFSRPYLAHMYRTWALFIPCWLYLFCITFMIGIRYMAADTLMKKDEMTYLWTFLLITIKIVFFRTDTMKKVLDEMFELENNIEKEDVGVRQKYLEHSRYNFKIFYAMMVMFFGTLSQLFWLMTSGWPKKVLFCSAWFPFDGVKYYTYTFVFQAVGILISGVYLITFDTFFTGIILFPTMLLDILGYKLAHFGDRCKEQDLQPELVLRNLIIEHQAIVRYVGKLNIAMRWYFFIDFLVKSYHLSVMVVSLVKALDEGFLNLTFAMSKFVFWSLEAWCIYYQGNELVEKSLDIPDRIFDSNWYEHNLVVKKMFLIIMLRSTKPLELQMGVFQTLNNDLMVKFFKAAYTVFAWSNKWKN